MSLGTPWTSPRKTRLRLRCGSICRRTAKSCLVGDSKHFDGLNHRTVHRAVKRASLRARDRVVGRCGSKMHYLQI